jgi:hypothetical protein
MEVENQVKVPLTIYSLMIYNTRHPSQQKSKTLYGALD